MRCTKRRDSKICQNIIQTCVYRHIVQRLYSTTYVQHSSVFSLFPKIPSQGWRGTKTLAWHFIQRFRCTTFYGRRPGNIMRKHLHVRCRMCPKDRGATATKRCTGCCMKSISCYEAVRHGWRTDNQH